MEPIEPNQAPAITTPEPPTLRRLFLGDDGLRAGWSFALYLLLVALIAFSLKAAILHFHLLPTPTKNAAPHDMTPRSAIIGDGINFAVMALAAWLMSFIERRPFSRYGFSLRRALPDFLIGILWGFAMLSALAGTLLLTHHLAFDGILLHGHAAAIYAAKWALGFLLVGLFEEFGFRGYFQYTIARGVSGIARTMSPNFRHAHAVGFWVSAFIFSMVLFTLTHVGNSGETLEGILAVAGAGAVLVFSLYRTGTLWWAIGWHAAWDWAQTFFYGTPDSGLHGVGHLLGTHPTGSTFLSGGSAGPEGSLFVLPTLALTALVIHLTLPRRTYPLTPDQSPTR
ncbi:CPBP family intramembrane glutamic endopeptidase [Granulicella tundricola]|uniref:Abortive infection protein n=1 Tax=Granulicella tundricola (strain ATCC BAA-1859 / DSM 23138 / MP5ACTX9) TaxID=1198114 RepID=E8X320_GRATM|nr:CPBP family intramembrane glutamic endopeptidase [Granulicella tundricola]ADW68154.1 Abortive infection protein [Granulicella tundricola MP5ACTX9]